MSEPDEAAVEAVAHALYDCDWPNTCNHAANKRRATAVLATPVVAGWRRDAETLAKVRAIVDEPVYQDDPEPVYRVRYFRIAEMIGGQS